MVYRPTARMFALSRPLAAALCLTALAGCGAMLRGRGTVRPGSDLAFPETETRSLLESLINPCELLQGKSPSSAPASPTTTARECPKLALRDSVAMSDSARRVPPQKIP